MMAWVLVPASQAKLGKSSIYFTLLIIMDINGRENPDLPDCEDDIILLASLVGGGAVVLIILTIALIVVRRRNAKTYIDT